MQVSSVSTETVNDENTAAGKVERKRSTSNLNKPFTPLLNLTRSNSVKAFNPNRERKTSRAPQRNATVSVKRTESQANAPLTPSKPAYMGDILDDIFGGSIKTPGIKAVEDKLVRAAISSQNASQEFKKIRSDPHVFLTFYNDVREHTMLESMHFILEVEEFNALPSDFSLERENDIIEEYLTVGARNEINIPDTERTKILSKRGTGDKDLFLDAQKYVIHMMIRNVDHTWKYNHVVPVERDLRSSELKREIEKYTQNQRIVDLILYFLRNRLTTIMFNIRNSEAYLLNKIRNAVPTGKVHITIKNLTDHKFSPTTYLYFKGMSFYQYQSGTVQDKNSKSRSSSKSGLNHFLWNEKLIFDVKDHKAQVIVLHLWEKKVRSTMLGSFVLKLADLIEDPLKRGSSELIIKTGGIGKVLVFFDYYINEEVVNRIKKEKEEKKNMKNEYDWLL